MSWFQNQSLRIKLITLIMAVSLVVVALLSGARIMWDIRKERSDLANQITTLAELLGNRSTAALAFRDNRLAYENLAVLQDLSHVIAGCLYFSDGEIASAFSRPESSLACPEFEALDSHLAHDNTEFLNVRHDIHQEERYLGAIYLVSDFSPLEKRINEQLIFSGIAIGVAVMLTLLLAGFLQRLITGPVAKVTEVAREIRTGKNPHLRAHVSTQDEIGELADNFNRMLDTLLQQSDQLQHAKTKQDHLLSKYQMLFENASDAIFLLDQETGQFIDVNPIAVERYGYTRDEFLKMRIKDIAAADARVNVSALLEKVKTDGHVIFEHKHCSKESKVIPVEVSSRAITMDGREILLSFVRDITERKQAEEKIHQLSEVVEQSPNAVVITDIEGKIVYVNPAFENITGYSVQEVMGRNPRILKSKQMPDSAFDEMWKTISYGQTWQGEIVNQKKDGSSYLEEQTIKPLKGTDGKITHFVAINQDVTERRRTEDALRRAQKMEAVGHLAGGIAHDFNNQLGIVIGYLDFLERRLKEDDKAHEWVGIATRATQRCVDLVRQLLVFSRRQGKEQAIVDINQELLNMDKLIERSVTPAIIVNTQLADKLQLVEMDAGELQDCILNLIINARDAMPDGGKLTIKTENLDVASIEALKEPNLKPQAYVRITIIDNGEGMTETVQEHAFEPFFTTKAIGKGTGLGLAMVYGFVERNNGHIKIESRQGQGTVFELYFPIAEHEERKPAEVKAIKHAPIAASQQSECVLIVDDEIEMLSLAESYLQSLGYASLRAQSANEALEVLRSGNQVDVLFSDVVMPGFNGFELAEQVRREFPHVKILLTSGFTSDTLKDKFAGDSIALLQKPYRKEALAERLRKLIETGEVA